LGHLPVWERAGSFAEKILLDESIVVLKPSALSLQQAASLPLVGVTALQALKKLNVKDKTVLIHAAAGGVGHLAVQIAHLLGAKEIVAAASPHNHAFVKSLGADRVIDRHHWQNQLTPHYFDAIFDIVGEPVTTQSLDFLKPGGHMISILNPLDEDLVKKHNISFEFIIVGTNQTDLQQLMEWARAGKIKAHIHEVFPFSKLPEALEKQKSGKVSGKIVVEV